MGRSDAILTAATRVFAKHGIAEVTVEDLLQAANVSRRTFYQYFDGKDGVVDALYDVSCGLMIDAIRKAAAEHADPNERLVALIDVYLAFNRNRTTAALFHVLEVEALRSGRLAARRQAVVDAVGNELARHLTTSDTSPDPYLVHAVVVAL